MNERKLLAWRAGLACGLLALAGCAATPVSPRARPQTPHTPLPQPAASPAPATSGAPAPASSAHGPATASPVASDTTKTATAGERLARRIATVIDQPRFAHATWGIDVVDLDSGRELYRHHAGKLFIPASNTKLYTTALALHTLGASYRFRTSLYATRKPGRDGVLRGNLILYGRGDPSLGAGSDTQTPTQWADSLAQAVADMGIHTIRGNVVADATYYQGTPVGAGWEANDLQDGFAPLASPLSVQENTFALRVDSDGNRCCEVSAQPSNGGVIIDNLTRTVPRGGRNDLGLHRPPGGRTLYVYGGLRAHSGPRSFEMSSPDPALMAGQLLRDALVRHDVALHGRVTSRQWPQPGNDPDAPGLLHIADILSPPLSELVRHTLKHSDNLYAQLLLLAVGRQRQQSGRCDDQPRPPRTTEQWGLCAMRAMLRTVGVPSGDAEFEEGSGLSRKDIVTPQATTRLLAWVRRQPFYQAFYDALPVAGVDGTLRYRLRGTDADDDMHAKTGTLRYAYALSGYVTDAAGRPLAFSIMLNGYHRPVDARGHRTGPSVRKDIDAVARAITDTGETRKLAERDAGPSAGTRPD